MSIVTTHKLLTEQFDPESFEFILEEKNNKEQSTLYVKGPYLVANEVNKKNMYASRIILMRCKVE